MSLEKINLDWGNLKKHRKGENVKGGNRKTSQINNEKKNERRETYRRKFDRGKIRLYIREWLEKKKPKKYLVTEV